MTKIAVLCSGGGTNLQTLLDAQKEGKLGDGNIVLVVSSNEKAYALERAKLHHIESVVLNKKQFETEYQLDQTLCELLQSREIGLVVLAGYLGIIGSYVLRQYEHRIINVHPSLIPSFCGKGMYGLKVHQAALDYGVKVTGATVHFVSEVVDGGEIILQQAVSVLPEDTSETLQRRVMEEAEWVLLPRAVGQLCSPEQKK